MADGHEITLVNAAVMTNTWRESSSFELFNGRKAVAFNKDAIARLMIQDGYEGIRCHFAITETGDLDLVITAYDKQDNDLLIQLVDSGNPCPQFCGDANDLNN